MTSGMRFDEEAAHRVQASYLTPDVVEQRCILRATLDLQPGEDVLDIGSGPGLLAFEMASAVGPTGSVHGIDASEAMRAMAERRPRLAGSAPASFAVADACSLPFEHGSFDAAVSTQVYEYVEDITRALGEAHRVLRPGGRLLILDTDWDSIVWHSGDSARMRRLLAAWDEHLVDPHLPRRLAPLLADAGFSVTERSVIPLLNTGFDPNTYSAHLIGFVKAFVPGRGDITAADATAWAEDLVALGDDYFFSLNRYLFAAVRP